MNPQITSQDCNEKEETSSFSEPTSSRQQPEKIFVPPMRYNLLLITSHEALSQIGKLTNSFCDLPFDFGQMIQYNIWNRRFTNYGVLSAPNDVEIIKQIIGINGFNMKLTTVKHGVDFIWHDRAKNEFQFWGEHQSCVRAMNAIRYRICKFEQKCKE